MTFNFYGQIDVKSIKEKINNLDWDSFDYRQKNSEGNHAATKSVPLIFDENRKEAIKTNNYQLFEEELTKISEIFKEKIGDGILFTALLINLPAGKKIGLHTDVGENFEQSRRIHIPIQTNEECLFSVEEDTRNLKEGEIWEINNTGKNHKVVNNGNTDRIHLLVDWKSTKKEKSLL